MIANHLVVNIHIVYELVVVLCLTIIYDAMI